MIFRGVDVLNQCNYICILKHTHTHTKARAHAHTHTVKCFVGYPRTSQQNSFSWSRDKIVSCRND